jgi:hypothetical protein
MSNQIVISSGAKVRDLNGVLTGTSGIVSSVPLGAANGVATLDSGGKVPVSQLPSSVVTYLGTWNAATNTPTLVNGTGDAGDMYICNVAGTVNFGAGPVTFAVGDWVLYGSGTWQKSNGQNGTVTSVAVTESGDALTITGSPITTAGTINIGFAGTTAQYVNGAGGLTTFPSLAGYVTSVTATAPLVSSGGTTPDLSIPAASASVDGYLDNADWTTFNNKQNAITLTTTGTSGVSTLVGSTLNIPNYSTDLSGYVPYTGATANVNLGTFNLTADVITGATGSFASNGGSNTFAINHSSGSGIALNITKGGNGEGLYINKTSGSGNAATIIGTLNATTLVKSGGTSSQFLKADGSVDASAYITLTSLSGGAGISYNNTTGVIASTITQYTDALARASISLTTTGTSGAATYNNTTGVFNIPQYTDQYVGTVTSVAALTLGTTGTDLSSTVANGTTTPVITLNVPTASATNRGALSSTDWNTFNNKASTAALANYLPLAGGTLTGQTLVSYAMGADNGFIIQHSNLTQGISIGFNTIKASGTTANQNIEFYSKGTGIINLVSNTQVNGTFSALSTSSFGGNLTATGIGTFWDGIKGFTIGPYPSAGGYGALYVTTITATSNNYTLAASSSETVLSVPTSGTIVLGINATAKLKINANGFISIAGTAGTANERLDVDGAIQVRSDSVGFGNTLSVGMLDFYAGYTRLLSFGTASTYGGFEFYAAKQNNAVGYTALRMFPSGNLSINNTTDSGFKLDVTGTGRFSSTLSADRVLTSNNTNNSTLVAGSIEIQSFSLNNCWIGDNIYFDSGFKARNTGYVPQIYFQTDGSIALKTGSTTVTAGGASNNLVRINIANSGGITMSSLAGTGTRIVGADSNGLLSGITIGSGLSLSGGTLTATGGSAGTVTGSGSNSQVSFWTSSSNISGSNSFIWDNTNGRLGIGFQGGAKLYVGAAVNNAAGDISQVAQFIASRATIAYPLTVSSAGTGVTNDEIRITFNYGVGFSATAYIASYLDNVTTAQTGLTFGTYNGGLIQSMRLTAEGNLLIGSNSNNGYKLQINGSASFAYGFLSVYRGSSSPNDILVGNSGSTFYVGGSVTATGGFFDTSDSRLKILVKDYEQQKGIENVAARMYVKNNRKELGYYAQDLQEILPSAVSEGSDGFLTLSYSQVHTAKIAHLEKEIAELKELIKQLL